uniref:CARD domain-containing protein n=1 Tax=Plectus sambesii TaxID=2011161 RepID=A0A914UPF3_9BILA
MKEEYRELINKCRPRLIEAISRSGCLDELINHLGWQDPNGDNGLISDNIIQIKEGNHANDDAKAGTFLDILTTRGEDIFDHFINAIHATNQTGLIEILVSELLPNQRIQNERSTSAASASAHASSSVYIFNNQDNKGRMVGGPVHGGFVNLGDNNQFLFHTHPAPSSSFQPSIEDWKKTLYNIQSSLRRIYSKSYRNVIPFSLPFFFDIEEKWVNLTLKLETESTDTTDCITWFNEEFAKADMLIIEGDPGNRQSKEMQLHRATWEVCMMMVKVCLNQMKRLLNGTENQRNKDMQLHKMTWDLCIGMGVVYLNQMKKLSDCSEYQQSKEMRVGSLT